MLLRTLPLLLLISVPAPAARAACPTAALTCGGTTTTYVGTTDALRSLDCDRLTVDSDVSFNHLAGLVDVRTYGGSNHANAILLDTFVLSGLPVGTVVPIDVVADVALENIRQVNAGTVSSANLWTAPIAGAPDPSSVYTDLIASAPGTETATRQLRLAMNFTVGNEYEISLSAGASSSGGAGGSVHARLSFQGLPPGATITSCKGFTQNQPVPTLPVSWGAIKAVYR
jgi:hypothetical protein